LYLTKSRFKIGISCPTKLYYESNSQQFDNNDDVNEFMKALAKGGLQSGELAKLYYPGGIEIDGDSKERQLEQTNTALKQENVIIYEAAIKIDHKFIRVDILEKKGKAIKVIEVKSKSCDGVDESQFFNKSNKIESGERPYLEDIAFQYLVCLEAFPECNIIPYLMMPNKQIKCSIDGLYSQFVIKKKGIRDECKVAKGVTKDKLGVQIMSAVKVKDTVEYLINDDYYRVHPDFGGRSFKAIIDWFNELLVGYENNAPCYFTEPFVKCRNCEYKSTEIKKSGFHQCMIKKKNWRISDFERPKVWDVWNSPKLKDFLNEGRWFMNEIDSSDINIGTRSDRQILQIENTNNNIKEAYIDIEGLKAEFAEFDWPLNLIDFETTGPAIPFFKGYEPYQGLCFQFSHHTLHKDGRVEHAGEYLGIGQGKNPSFEFIEELHISLSKNDGDVFMYSNHENTYLNYMIKLLWKESPYSPEKTEKFVLFLQSLTKPSGDITPKWEEGSRKMIDMAVMVRSYYWHPDMKGSNSIKKVLPAIMNDSQFIKDKYSKPIYGINKQVKSLNFKNHKWVQFEKDGTVMDPYKNLPDLENILPEGLQKVENLFSNNKLADGGAAMTAWAFMQFGDMGDEEKKSISDALKRYCELDTMAMVIIMEAWKDMING
jgi:hypothetical protein